MIRNKLIFRVESLVWIIDSANDMSQTVAKDIC